MDAASSSTSIVSRRPDRSAWDALTVTAIVIVIATAGMLHVVRFAPNYDVEWLLIAASGCWRAEDTWSISTRSRRP